MAPRKGHCVVPTPRRRTPGIIETTSPQATLVYTLGSDGHLLLPASRRELFLRTTGCVRSPPPSHCSLLRPPTTDGWYSAVTVHCTGEQTETLLPEDKIVRAPSPDTPDEPGCRTVLTEGDDKRLVISQSARANPCRMIEAALDRWVSEHWNVQVKENGQAQYRLHQSAPLPINRTTKHRPPTS